MGSSVKIIADSISPDGIRLTTMQLRYQRFIHSEFMTHRMFSRNASSSRAIPVERMIEELRRDPAMPVSWGQNQKGMQAGVELGPIDIAGCREMWLSGMEDAIVRAQVMLDIGLHKQIANRILEPWAHINVVVTATDWDNFFELRCHKDAQPEIRVLAEMMREEMRLTIPHDLQPGEWHLPYVMADERDHILTEQLIRISIARCARVSYLTHDGRQSTIDEDLALADRLLGAKPWHASPAEHQATPDIDMGKNFWKHAGEHGNFRGWRQYRKILENENG